MSGGVVLVDSSALINLYKSGGTALLDALVANNTVIMSDVVQGEATTDLSFPQDQAIQSLISSGAIQVENTSIDPSVDDAGELSLAEIGGDLSASSRARDLNISAKM